MGKLIAVQGAILQCSSGSVTAPLLATCRTAKFGGQWAANIKDFVPGTNIPTFGWCSSTLMMCNPKTSSPWIPVLTTVNLWHPVPNISEGATLSCSQGGVINIVYGGQPTISICNTRAAGPMCGPLPPAAAARGGSSGSSGSGADSADGCGAAASVVNACGAQAGACGVAVSAGSACGAQATACGAAISGGTACGAEAAACGAAASGATACGVAATACGAAASGATACGAAIGGCGVDASGAEACGVQTACAADACGADACIVDITIFDLSPLDVCAVDIVPIIPFI